MEATILGIQKIKFTNSDGKIIAGTNIFCAFKDENVEGLRADKFYIKDGIKIPDCKINDTIEISFNMKGKVEGLYSTK